MTANRDPAAALATTIVCQVVGIMLTAIALLPIVVLVILVYAASQSNWAMAMVDYDPYYIVHVLTFLLPPCLWWWLYTKTMRWIAMRLNLTRASRELGVPFTGEIAFVAGLMGYR